MHIYFVSDVGFRDTLNMRPAMLGLAEPRQLGHNYIFHVARTVTIEISSPTSFDNSILFT